IGKIAKAAGILFHTDAVQAVGAVPIDVNALQVDMLSLSGHKFHAPKGVGALYIRKGVKIKNLIYGGAQERGLRAGTENVPGIVGLGKAIELAVSELPEYTQKMTHLRDRLIDGILAEIPNVRLNGHRTLRLPANVNVSVRYVEGEALLMRLDLAGIEGSSGSACTSGSLDPSHVLLAIGLPHEIAHGSLRLSLGTENTDEDVDKVLAELPKIVENLRAMSPLNPVNA
ncbi:MAG: aminotransferase class V-fold PLP-dependent enzyme, partial [Clostridia bacterium]